MVVARVVVVHEERVRPPLLTLKGASLGKLGHTFTPEELKKAREVKALKAERRRTDPSFAVREALPDLFSDLLQAARGQGKWGGYVISACDKCADERRVAIPALMPDKRLSALFKALEYGMGRPIALDKQGMKPDHVEEEEVRETEGLAID